MTGRRLPDSLDGTFGTLEPGDYVQIVGGSWFEQRQRQYPGAPIWIVRAPNGQTCSLNHKHTFTINADGSLTVSPSILMSTDGDGKGQALWHGYLENGIWRTC